MGRKQKGHLQVFGNFDLAKDQRRSIKLSPCYKSTRMQNAKPILGVHKCQERRIIYQFAINAKPNCQTVGYEILRVLKKNKNVKPICKTVGVALSYLAHGHLLWDSVDLSLFLLRLAP